MRKTQIVTLDGHTGEVTVRGDLEKHNRYVAIAEGEEVFKGTKQDCITAGKIWLAGPENNESGPGSFDDLCDQQAAIGN